ncbi:MAG TPA: hypothetical protein VE641_08715, partial [Chthoniobacterales bacterium]|nr:hypothetical protein [Chthoniobacterales bacterium]
FGTQTHVLLVNTGIPDSCDPHLFYQAKLLCRHEYLFHYGYNRDVTFDADSRRAFYNQVHWYALDLYSFGSKWLRNRQVMLPDRFADAYHARCEEFLGYFQALFGNRYDERVFTFRYYRRILVAIVRNYLGHGDLG